MKAETREWVRCAEEDFDVANALFRRRTKTAANSIAFHCQQCVEKYFKGRLEELGLSIPKTHNLPALLALLAPHHAPWTAFMPPLLLLNNYAVKFRYPGGVATRADARGALKACRSIRAEVRHSLGLPRK
jgi:HEPN domain-containing protein